MGPPSQDSGHLTLNYFNKAAAICVLSVGSHSLLFFGDGDFCRIPFISGLGVQSSCRSSVFIPKFWTAVEFPSFFEKVMLNGSVEKMRTRAS